MTLIQYERFLPGAEAFQALVDWVRNYFGIEYAWDYELVLQRDEVPRVQLGGSCRLGWTTWALSARPEEDVHDFSLDPERWLKERGRAVRGRACASAVNAR
jgi:type VI secretion system protein ImpH